MPGTKQDLVLVKKDPYLRDFEDALKYRLEQSQNVEREICAGGNLQDFANGHHYYGLFKTESEWIFREWAPNAKEIYLIGPFSQWKKDYRFALKRISSEGDFEIRFSLKVLKHLDQYKLLVVWGGGQGERIPSYANYVVQDPHSKIFTATVWDPPSGPYKIKNKSPVLLRSPLLIYEAHIGIAQIEGKVSSYEEFRTHVLPRIAKNGYNAIQLMAIPEHPYYGSFGYQVSSFFAPSSRFGSPDDLKRLIDDIHALGIIVLLDIVHSHAVRNEVEGLGRFDGTRYQYFHDGAKGEHPAWDTYCFDYGKAHVLHFLLSNCKYWMEEFAFDGFRFDGVTSMLYFHHGLGSGFNSYHDYFNHSVDMDAVVYLTLANKLIHEYKKSSVTIAEDVSGMPGLAAALEDGGIGFDYRLGMGIPDFWIRTLKHVSDENWSVEHIFNELTNRRNEEKTISYAESHDQALVGDKTIIFWLADQEMYWNMSLERRNAIIDRAISLSKMIRFATLSLSCGGYLNFMGNEFGHPEWIDFPREGNSWSYHYARRQWNLRDDPDLCYKFLADFDEAMIKFIQENDILLNDIPQILHRHVDDHVLAFKRDDYIFVFNFHPSKSYTDYAILTDESPYREVFSTDDSKFGGYERVKMGSVHFSIDGKIYLYLPSRVALVLKSEVSSKKREHSNKLLSREPSSRNSKDDFQKEKRKTKEKVRENFKTQVKAKNEAKNKIGLEKKPKKIAKTAKRKPVKANPKKKKK